MDGAEESDVLVKGCVDAKIVWELVDCWDPEDWGGVDC